MSLAVLGLIGTGAHAVFTTSTTSSQTITAGTWGAPPTVAITYPVNNTTYGSNWTGSITGTASSNSGSGTSITAVSVAIEDTATGQWWNGTSFSATAQTFVTASGTTNWSLALAGSSLSTGDAYSVVAQATDSLGYVGTSSTVSFTYCLKTSPPTVIITYPVNNTTYGTNWGGAITGTASAGAGATISKVKVSIQQVGGSCWTGSGDTYTATCPNYVAVTSGTTNWSLTVPNSDLTSGDRYKVTAQATDSLGYIGTSSTVSFTYCLKTSPPTLTITASSGSMTYGGTVPTITPSYSGFVNGDTPASLTTAPTCSTTATSSSPAGPYPSSCSGAVDANYTITYVPGTLTVNASGAPPTLTITASSGSMTYGGTVPTITPSYSGFVNGDTPASLTTAPTCSTTATSSSPAGPHPSSCSGAVDANYTISYVTGSVSVGPAPSSTVVTNSAPTGLSTSATFTYTATVSGPGVTPTGTVTWTLTGPGSPTCSASTLSGGLATCTITGVAVGSYTAKATYGGDTNYTGSSGQDNLSAYQFTSTLVQTVTVTTPGPTITVTSPGKGGPPRILGKVQPEIYVAAVGPWTLFSHQTVHLKIHLWGRRGTVTGTVKLLLGKTLLCAPKLANGRGRCTLSSSKIGRGRHYLLLMYSGSSQYLAVIHHVDVYVHSLAAPRTGR
jgi:hypothetical protein